MSTKSRGSIRSHKPSAVDLQVGKKEILSPLSTWIATVVVAFAVLAVYSPALNFKFILDDHRFVNDRRVQSPGHLWEYFTSYVWSQFPGGPSSFYRPVFILFMRLNFILSGISPWGWHLISILTHLLVGGLLGFLVWRLLRNRVAALIAATLFALHPAQTESVAWVTVPDPLMAAAVLGTLLLYLWYEELACADNQIPAGRSQKKRNRSQGHALGAWRIAFASAAACLAALMTKETAIVVPSIIFAMAFVMPVNRRREAPERESAGTGTRVASAFRETLPFTGVTVIYFLFRINALGGGISPRTQQLPWSTVLLSWPATLWFYCKVLLWPAHERAFADPTLADTFSLRGVLLSGLGVCFLAAILAGAYIWARRTAVHDLSQHDLSECETAGVERALLLGTLLLVLPILPALNLNALNPGDFLHGRYTYLSLTGLMLLAATGWHLAKKSRIVLLLAAGLVALAFGVLTIQQESMWKDDLTVFTVGHQYAPNNAPVAHNLAKANVQIALDLDEAGRCDQAMPMFEQAIQQYPQDWFAWAGRGECLLKSGNLPDAEQSLHRASELAHEPRVTEQWQQVRAMMGLSSATTQ